MGVTHWVFRILQETRLDGFPPCRNVVFRGNVIVFQRGRLRGDVNIGDDYSGNSRVGSRASPPTASGSGTNFPETGCSSPQMVRSNPKMTTSS